MARFFSMPMDTRRVRPHSGKPQRYHKHMLAVQAKDAVIDQIDNFVHLGKLKGNLRNQNYGIPSGVGPAGSVVMYCKPFRVIFSVASVQEAG